MELKIYHNIDMGLQKGKVEKEKPLRVLRQNVRKLAGAVVDLRAKARGGDYSAAVRAVLSEDPELKKDYIGG